MAKNAGKIEEQTRKTLKLTIENIECCQKRTKFEQFLRISDHADMKSTKRGILQQKIPKKSQS